MQISVTEFKNHSLRYLHELRKSDEAIFISKRGKVVAKLAPVHDEQAEKPWRILQSAGGKTTDDLLQPVVFEDRKLPK